MNFLKCGLLSFLLILFIAACSIPVSYVRPTADFAHIKRVALIPFENLTQQRGVDRKVMNVVAAEVLRRGVFDVVEFGEVDKVLQEDGVRSPGSIGKRGAERAAASLNVQAFILGSVEEYGLSRASGSTYPEVSLSLKLLDATSYHILWEATHSKKGATVLDRLFGIGRKSTSDVARELVEEILDTLFEN